MSPKPISKPCRPLVSRAPFLRSSETDQLKNKLLQPLGLEAWLSFDVVPGALFRSQVSRDSRSSWKQRRESSNAEKCKSSPLTRVDNLKPNSIRSHHNSVSDCPIPLGPNPFPKIPHHSAGFEKNHQHTHTPRPRPCQHTQSAIRQPHNRRRTKYKRHHVHMGAPHLPLRSR